MSDMFETKTDKASRKLERTKKEEKARRKTRTIAITIIVVLVLVSAAAILVNSSFIRRTLPVVTIDGVDFTTTEFEFFFNSELMEYNNMMAQFQGMGIEMPDPGRPLSSQIRDEESGETWADIITEMAFTRMTNIVSLYNAAKAAGFELPYENYEEIENDISMIAVQAMMSGFPTTDSFLQQMFGNSINESTYREILEFSMLAASYGEYVRESFSYSAQEITGYYEENKDDLDVFSFRLMYINPEVLNYDDFASDEAYEEALETATADAHERAAHIMTGGIESAEDFIAAAQEESGNTADWIAEVQFRMGENLDDVFRDWLMDEERIYGDIAAFDNDTGSTIIYFVARDDNSYQTVGMKQILIIREQVDPEEFPLGEDDMGYIRAVENAEAQARERADTVYSLFDSAGRSVNALNDLIDDFSDDNTEGGEYSEIAKFSYQSSHFQAMKVVPEIEEWLFDESRVVGDSEMIRTEAFGYHLIYFTGFDAVFSELIADDRMRTRDHTEWLDGLTVGEPRKHFAFILVHT